MLKHGERLCGAILILMLALTGSTVGLNYKRPNVAIPATYRAATVPNDQAPLVDTKCRCVAALAATLALRRISRPMTLPDSSL